MDMNEWRSKWSSQKNLRAWVTRRYAVRIYCCTRFGLIATESQWRSPLGIARSSINNVWFTIRINYKLNRWLCLYSDKSRIIHHSLFVRTFVANYTWTLHCSECVGINIEWIWVRRRLFVIFKRWVFVRVSLKNIYITRIFCLSLSKDSTRKLLKYFLTHSRLSDYLLGGCVISRASSLLPIF